MKKEVVSKKKHSHKSLEYLRDNSDDVKVEKILVENFVSLQKVMTNLSVKFDSLTNQISKLLELFEISAKSLAKKDFDLEKENKDSKKIVEKIDNLLDQNKIIARGLTLIHEKVPEENFPQQQEGNSSMPDLMRQTETKINTEKRTGAERYQKSISSND